MFSIGELVKLKNSNICGIITSIKDKNNKRIYSISIKDKNIITDEESIQKIDNKYTDKKAKRTIHTYYNYENNFVPEITIRHQTLDIAMYNVENFVNEAIQNNIKNIKIIHGRNGGVLRNAVHEYLNHNKNIESFRLGNYYEGSYGVTLVKLK